MEDDEIIDDDPNPPYFHPRSHSLCSNLLYASTSPNNNIGQSLTAIPPFQQQTLVGIEALDGGGGNGGLFFNEGRTSPSNRLMVNNIPNNGNNNGGGINFARRISRQDPQRPHLPSSWLERTFQKRECIKFIPADTHSDRCHCGRPSSLHSQLALSRFTSSVVIHGDLSSAAGHISGQWTIGTCTAGSPTDAYGTIEFQGGTHVHKARYVRLSFDSDPLDVITLMERVWGFERPRLVISVHGGTADFDVPEKLGRMFREGLLKAAETTGAWVFTSGLDSGVVKHVARALDEAGISARMRSRIVTVGIAPWGLLKRSEQLIGCDSRICYDRQAGPQGDDEEYGEDGRLFLNDRHSYFLLVDNGTVDRYGAEIVLRRRLEEFLAGKTGNGNGNRIPIICVALEGGLCTLNGIHQFLHGQPPIPVIICEGSGRISDLLAMAEQHLDSDGKLPANIRSIILKRISHKLSCNSVTPIKPETILNRIIECARHGNKLLTVYRCHRDHKMMDHVILHTLLHGQKLARVDQLLMALAWGREDIARSEIFRQSAGKDDNELLSTDDPDWLFQPMMEALLMGNVDFVRLILEQGLSPKRFLTFERLEQLYNNSGAQTLMMIKKGRTSNLNRTSRQASTSFSLPQIGEAIERLMGNAFRSGYTTRAFKARYERAKSKSMANSGSQLKGGGGTLGRQFSSLNMCLGGGSNVEEEWQEEEMRPAQRKCAFSYSASPFNGHGKDQLHHNSFSIPHFAFPFNELMLWAVLTRRHQMAKLFWEYGEEPMAKALAAIRLYKCMSREAAHDYTEVELSNQLRECAQEFRECSLELLNHCHQQDQRMTMKLLTAELANWGGHTCLSLAVIANNKRFLAHPCCQILLAELWHGGLRFRSQSNVKVVLGLVFPPSILLLDFKTLNTVEREEGMNSMKTNQKYEDSLLSERENLLLEKKEAEGCDLIKKKKQQQKITFLSNALSKFVLFYSAPITSFWIWSISFFLFMLALIYVLLIEFPREVPWLEWFIFVYVFAMALEHFRKLFVLESSSLFEKHRIFYNKYWNILTTVGILTYFVGFAFRLQPDKMHSYGRVILATNSVLWHMKMFDFLSVHPRIGPYITMAGKMVLAMSYIIVLLMVTLMAFGVARQSITFPHEKWAWILVRNIFYKPYFMLYGEVYAGEIDTCGDEGTNCVPGHWIPPILMTIFLLIANILLINMLIAIFNNIFNVTNAMSQQVWLFQRYGQVLEYKSTPVLPPPFTPIAHILMIIRHFCKSHPVCPFHHHQHGEGNLKNKSNGLNNDGDFALKPFYRGHFELSIGIFPSKIDYCLIESLPKEWKSPQYYYIEIISHKEVQLGAEELGELQDFEEDCMDDLCRRKCRQNMTNNLTTIKHQNHCDGDGGKEEHLALQIRQIQLKLDQFGAIQQRLIAHLMANSPTNKQCSANDEGKKPVGNNRLQNMKLIPRARIRPISCWAPTNNSGTFPQAQNANISQQQNQRLRSSPNIPVPQDEFATSTATTNFTLFEEEMAENGSMLLEEEEENGQQQIWGEEIGLESSVTEAETRSRPRNYSISLGEDLEQMFGMLRK